MGKRKRANACSTLTLTLREICIIIININVYMDAGFGSRFSESSWSSRENEETLKRRILDRVVQYTPSNKL